MVDAGLDPGRTPARHYVAYAVEMQAAEDDRGDATGGAHAGPDIEVIGDGADTL